jgi:hypothetical protein
VVGGPPAERHEHAAVLRLRPPARAGARPSPPCRRTGAAAPRQRLPARRPGGREGRRPLPRAHPPGTGGVGVRRRRRCR